MGFSISTLKRQKRHQEKVLDKKLKLNWRAGAVLLGMYMVFLFISFSGYKV